MSAARSGAALAPREDEEQKNTLATTAVLDALEGGEGRGVSTEAADNIVPLVYILQPQSPQAMRGKPEYMPGAEAGVIWLRGYAQPFIPGSEGMLFQSCYYYKEFVEWRPERGGFVARHPFFMEAGSEVPGRYVADKDGKPVPGRSRVERHPDARAVPNEKNPRFVDWKMGENDLVLTRNHAGYIHGHAPYPIPYIVPFSSTGHAVSQQWMQTMNMKRTPKGNKPDSWAALYRLKTRMRTNNDGSWYTFEVHDEGWVRTVEDLERGRALHDAFVAGEKQGEAPQQADAGASGAARDERHI